MTDRDPGGAPGRPGRGAGGRPRVVIGFTVADGRIVAIDLVADPSAWTAWS
ncbi:MAG TPA: hypothetical protein VFC13_13635 [Actinomycetes bacterium]|nr:hypothetical protein [Actinomycetes bacterium]